MAFVENHRCLDVFGYQFLTQNGAKIIIKHSPEAYNFLSPEHAEIFKHIRIVNKQKTVAGAIMF